MKAKAWLVLELRRHDRYSSYTLHITSVRKTRPTNQLAVEIELEVPSEVIFPKVKALIEAGQLDLHLLQPVESTHDEIECPEPETCLDSHTFEMDLSNA